MAARDLLHRAAQQHHRVGGGQAGAGAKRELELARAELDLERAQRQAELLEIASRRISTTGSIWS